MIEDARIKAMRAIRLSTGGMMARLQAESLGLWRSVARGAWWSFAQSYLTLYHRFDIIDRDNLPAKPPFVLVSNHSSHLDALALQMAMPWRVRHHVRPLAAGDTFFETPALTYFSAQLMNAMPVWRYNCGLHALRALRQNLLSTDPCAYIIFPEGTRSRDGAMQPFRAGLGVIVAQTHVPVVPCYLDGCFDAMPPNTRMPRPTKLRLCVGEPMTFHAVNNKREGWERIIRDVEVAVTRLRARAKVTPQLSAM